MNKVLSTGAGIFGVIFCISLAISHNMLIASGTAFWALVAGLAACLLKQKPNSLALDMPVPLWYELTMAAAVHAVKTALVNFEHEGMRFRFLQLDPEVGVLLACMDLFQWAELEGLDVPLAVRRQLLLMAEFDRIEQHTRVKLSWHLHHDGGREVCNRIICDLTERVDYQLRGAGNGGGCLFPGIWLGK